MQLANFRVTLAEAGADSWHEWHESFVVRGQSDEKSERSGLLVLLDPSRRAELAQLQLSNLGIVALRPRASASGVMQWEAELYVERMRFTLGGKWHRAGTAGRLRPPGSARRSCTSPTGRG